MPGAWTASLGGCRVPRCDVERAARGAHADAVRSDHRRRHHRASLVPVGPVPGLPDDKCDRSTHAQSSPRRRDHKPHTGAVMPLVPAACPVRSTGPAIIRQHRRRNARGARAAGAPGLGSRIGRRRQHGFGSGTRTVRFSIAEATCCACGFGGFGKVFWFRSWRHCKENERNTDSHNGVKHSRNGSRDPRSAIRAASTSAAGRRRCVPRWRQPSSDRPTRPVVCRA